MPDEPHDPRLGPFAPDWFWIELETRAAGEWLQMELLANHVDSEEMSLEELRESITAGLADARLRVFLESKEKET